MINDRQHQRLPKTDFVICHSADNMNTRILVLFTILFATMYVQHPSGIRTYKNQRGLKKKRLKSKEEKPVCKVVGMEELNRMLENHNPYMVVEKAVHKFDHSTGEIHRDRRSTGRKHVKLKFAGVLSDDVLNREKRDLGGKIELDGASVSTTTPLPWICAEEKDPIDLDIDYYPDKVDNIACTHSGCWSDFFQCQAKTMNVTVFKLRDCVPPANSPNIVRKFWDEEVITVTTGCLCMKRIS